MEHLEGVDFFKRLTKDDAFCKELGKAILAAGKLESLLIKHYSTQGVEIKNTKPTLGKLIGIAEKREILGKMVPVLKELNEQRNYLAHNIYALFSSQVQETILHRTNLVDSDIEVFTDRARQLKENLDGLSDIVTGYDKELRKR